jgi:hypothetical protein
MSLSLDLIETIDELFNELYENLSSCEKKKFKKMLESEIKRVKQCIVDYTVNKSYICLNTDTESIITSLIVKNITLQ